MTLDDSEGLIVGANRLSVCLFKKGRFSQALKYNQTQLKYSLASTPLLLESTYQSHYNQAVILRLTGQQSSSLE